jgi:coiled-coil domain-containing protein 39
VARKAAELEKEVTETQAAQIELDKTAEEFKKKHNERHQLFHQVEEVVKNISNREKQIQEQTETYARGNLAFSFSF